MKKTSPTLIGAFVSAALLLGIGLLLFLGSSSLFSKNTRFILFFDQSVNGLAQGSLVKFRGVPVGSVERIMIRAEGQKEGSTAIPVVIKIDRTRLENDLGVVQGAFDPESIQASINRGLVAELSLESFITGQLFVEFSFSPERREDLKMHLSGNGEYLEIPTLSSTLDQITDDVASIIADLSQLDVHRLNENVNLVLENTSRVLRGIDSAAISQSIVRAADSFNEAAVSLNGVIRSDEFRAAVDNTQLALKEIRETVKSYHLEEGPLAQKLDLWTNGLTTALSDLQTVTSQAGEMMAADGSLRYELESMLRELSRAARSIRALSDFLEENPNSILTGRPGQE